MRATLNKYDLQKLEEYWSNYKQNKKLLDYRQWQLLSKNSDDENSGGGSNSVRTVSKPVEQAAIKLDEDDLYQNLRRVIHVVEALYTEADEDLKKIIDMRYWDNDSNFFEWEDIADALFMSRSKVLRKRNGLLDETAERVGWV